MHKLLWSDVLPEGTILLGPINGYNLFIEDGKRCEIRGTLSNTKMCKIEFSLGFTRVKSLSGDNYLKVSLYNSKDRNCGDLIVDFDSIQNLQKIAAKRSAFFKRLPWDNIEEAIGLIDVIDLIIDFFPVEYMAESLGFSYSSDEPEYFAAATITDLKNPETPVPAVDFARVKNSKTNHMDCVKFLSQKGVIEETVGLVNKVSKGKAAVQAILSAAIACIICGWLKLNSFTFCIAGKSSTGKTTMLRLAASFFSDPDDGIINRRFSDTPKKLMEAISTKNGIMQTIDDTSSDVTAGGSMGKQSENNLKQLVYYISGNRSRGKVNAADTEFHTGCMLTAEVSIVDKFAMHADGARRRIVELYLDDYENHLTSDEKEAHEIEDVIKENYGHVAEKFVTDIARTYSINDLKAKYKEVRERLQDRLPNGGIAKGYGEVISVIVLAAELSEYIGFNFDAADVSEYLIDEYIAESVRYKKNQVQAEMDFKRMYTHAYEISQRIYPDLMEKCDGKYIYLERNDMISIVSEQTPRCTISSFKNKLVELSLLIKQDGAHYESQKNGRRIYEILLDEQYIEQESEI